MRLGDMTWTDLEGLDRPPLLAVPVGSCEQHGPHLPLDTDTRIATLLADGLAAARPGVVVAPALTVTASGEHQGFPGTLSIGTAVLAEVVVELVRSADWASGVVLVNGHGGNLDAVRRACAVLAREQRDVIAWWPPAGRDSDLHAGRTETSLLLGVAPGSVRRARVAVVSDAGDEPTLVGPEAHAALLDRLRAEGVRPVSPTGVLGDPAQATAEEGRRLFSAWVGHLVRAVERRWA
jgi:creatinine amidohydrolase